MQSFGDQNVMYKIFNKLKPVMATCQRARGPSYKCPTNILYESIVSSYPLHVLLCPYQFTQCNNNKCWSQWPCSLRRRSVAAHAETMGLNPTGGMDICLLWVLYCQVEVSAMSWSLIQRSPMTMVHHCV